MKTKMFFELLLIIISIVSMILSNYFFFKKTKKKYFFKASSICLAVIIITNFVIGIINIPLASFALSGLLGIVLVAILFLIYLYQKDIPAYFNKNEDIRIYGYLFLMILFYLDMGVIFSLVLNI